MGKSHPIELRSRVIAFVEEGNTHREASRHFRVSPRFVNNLVILKRETGSLSPRRQGHIGGGKLSDHGAWFRERVAEKGDLTIDELCMELAERGIMLLGTSVRTGTRTLKGRAVGLSRRSIVENTTHPNSLHIVASFVRPTPIKVTNIVTASRMCRLLSPALRS